MDPALDGVRLSVDKRRFERVLTNLIENAAAYGGGATKRCRHGRTRGHLDRPPARPDDSARRPGYGSVGPRARSNGYGRSVLPPEVAHVGGVLGRRPRTRHRPWRNAPGSSNASTEARHRDSEGRVTGPVSDWPWWPNTSASTAAGCGSTTPGVAAPGSTSSSQPSTPSTIPTMTRSSPHEAPRPVAVSPGRSWMPGRAPAWSAPFACSSRRCRSDRRATGFGIPTRCAGHTDERRRHP